jgi:hypothetical protein
MQLPTNEKDREILKEFIATYASHQWLRGANIIENHPTTFKKTLEVHVNYRPINEMLHILSFTNRYNLALEFIQVPVNETEK